MLFSVGRNESRLSVGSHEYSVGRNENNISVGQHEYFVVTMKAVIPSGAMSTPPVTIKNSISGERDGYSVGHNEDSIAV